jgi:hypothetical protein
MEEINLCHEDLRSFESFAPVDMILLFGLCFSLCLDILCFDESAASSIIAVLDGIHYCLSGFFDH